MPKISFIVALFLTFSLVKAQDTTIFCEQVQALQTLVETSHYSPKPLDNAMSEGVFELFLESIDEHNRFFLQSDIDAFEDDRKQLDDFIFENSCGFIDRYVETLKTRIEQSKSIVKSLSETDLDYSGKDTLYFKPKRKHDYFKNEASAKRYWSKRIRYQIIKRAIEEDSIFENIRQDFHDLEKHIKPKVIQNELCLLNERLHEEGKFELFVKEAFLNALINYQDPNSFFLNTSDKKRFEHGVANSELSFGIHTDKNDEGEIYIAHIVPGSAAFKNGNFEENDLIKQLTSGKDILETICVSNDDILDFINADHHKTITFKIKKSDGTIKDIRLTKTVVKVEENTIRGYILQNTSDVGYIQIPSFYTDLESPNGLGLANDVAKELIKLNKEKIKGLIIDLRFNGGGSMKEAADLSGMFIDRGPLSIIRYPNGETYTIRDINRGSLFTKPIVVLINNYSASASEFFAGVMQDYNRAVIVGSPSHGKSSAQVILPLSPTEDLGFCKITVEKFYRITGLSHQSQGIIPDVHLPSLYDNFQTNEQYDKYALSNDSIEATLQYHPFKPLPLELINAKSSKRITNNKYFSAINDINNVVWRDYVNKDSEYPLTLDNIYNDLNGYNLLWEDFYSKLNNQATSIQVRNTTSTEEILAYNEEDAKLNAITIADIENDIYLDEAYTILIDLLTTKTTN